MSEEATQVKKKGKLPVVLMVALLVGGGGFFAMKSKSGGPKKVEIKAGTVEALDKEFLVNLATPTVYLRAEIAVELREGFKKEELDASMPEIRDSVNQIFRSKKPEEIGPAATESLQKEIAKSINRILIDHMKDEDKKAQTDFEKAAPDAKSTDPKSEKKDADIEHWMCPAGPVLNVYFTSFTTQ